MGQYLSWREPGHEELPMCLGIPGQAVSAAPGVELARAGRAGVAREVRAGFVDGTAHPGDRLPIHRGFAPERMSDDEVRDAPAIPGLGRIKPESEMGA